MSNLSPELLRSLDLRGCRVIEVHGEIVGEKIAQAALRILRTWELVGTWICFRVEDDRQAIHIFEDSWTCSRSMDGNRLVFTRKRENHFPNNHGLPSEEAVMLIIPLTIRR